MKKAMLKEYKEKHPPPITVIYYEKDDKVMKSVYLQCIVWNYGTLF